MKTDFDISPTQQTYSEWQLAYDHFNTELFEGKLPYCLITLQREKKTMGYYSDNRFSNRQGEKTDEIALNPSYFAITSINENLQTLVHEMSHLCQQHFGTPGRGRYHNREFAKIMESVGLMTSSTGQPGGKRVGDCMSDYIIPDGPFIPCVKRLLNKGFELKWMDRYIARPSRSLQPYYNNLASASDIELEDQYFQEPTSIAMGDEVIKELESVAEAIEIDFSKIRNKQGGRSKYNCECGTNLWAKPGLSVTCNECETVFVEVN